MNDPNLTIKTKYGEYNNFEVKGWRGHIRHYAPVQAETAAAVSKFSKWQNLHGYDFMCYGHWHHWGISTFNGRLIFRNGSLAGGDDYAETFGSYDFPTQLMFGVTEEKVGEFITPIVYSNESPYV